MPLVSYGFQMDCAQGPNVGSEVCEFVATEGVLMRTSGLLPGDMEFPGAPAIPPCSQ